VNQSLRAADAETRRSEWRKHQVLSSRLALSRTRRQAGKDRLDHSSPIDLIAAQYPAVRRLVGELSFRAVARRFIFSEAPGAPISASYGDRFPLFIRSLGSAACIEFVADVAA
jgi:Putative DNA-binding domain